MKRTVKSFGHAFSGLLHAMKTETNFRRFVLAHIIVVLLGVWLQITVLEWIVIVIFGGGFLIVELFNTALERLTDTFDDCEKKHRGGHYHLGVKLTKDVAAAASLIGLSMDGVMLLLIFLPRIFLFLSSK